MSTWGKHKQVMLNLSFLLYFESHLHVDKQNTISLKMYLRLCYDTLLLYPIFLSENAKFKVPNQPILKVEKRGGFINETYLLVMSR